MSDLAAWRKALEATTSDKLYWHGEMMDLLRAGEKAVAAARMDSVPSVVELSEDPEYRAILDGFVVQPLPQQAQQYADWLRAASAELPETLTMIGVDLARNDPTLDASVITFHDLDETDERGRITNDPLDDRTVPRD